MSHSNSPATAFSASLISFSLLKYFSFGTAGSTACGTAQTAPLLPDYEKNVTAIVDQAQQAAIKLAILAPTLIRETLNNPNNKYS